MNTLVLSLKRLYAAKKVTKAKLKEMVQEEKITADEYEYITGTAYPTK